MTNRLIKLSVVSYTPLVLGTPGTKPRCYYVTERFYNVGGVLQQAQQQANAIARGPLAGLNGYIAGILSSQQFWGGVPYTEVQVYVCEPGTPATPSVPPVTNYDQQKGWNSGARSIKSLPADGYVQFQIGPLATGVVAGLALTDNSVLPNEITHGFYVHGGIVDILEKGVFVQNLPGVVLSTRPRLRVSRASGVVTYLVNEVVVATSAAPSVGLAHLDAVMYTASDYVDNPVVADVQRAKATMDVGVRLSISTRARAAMNIGVTMLAQAKTGNRRYLRAILQAGVTAQAAARSTHYAKAAVNVGVTLATRVGTDGVYGVAPPVALVAGDHPVNAMFGAYAAYQLDATIGFPETNAGGVNGVVPPGLMDALLLVGGIGGVTAQSPGFSMLAADRPYTAMSSAWGGHHYLVANSPPFLDEANVNMIEGMFINDFMRGDATQDASFASVLQLGSNVTAELVGDAEFVDVLLIATTMDAVKDLDAYFESALRLGGSMGRDRQATMQLAVNTVTNAFTTYQGFDFLKLVTTPAGKFGVREDGVYRITAGNGDNGEGIFAEVEFGGTNFDLPTLKRIDAMYFGMDTDGQVFAKLVGDNDQERVYKVFTRKNMFRANPARGVASYTWSLKLQCYDAKRAKVEYWQAALQDTGRRWTS